MKLGLSLSGGGVKGAAHIGVLKALEEGNIKIDYIAGTSSGSIVATLYAVGYTADEIYDIFKKYCKEIKYADIKNILKLVFGLIIKREIIIDGLNSGQTIYKLINQKCREKNKTSISDIELPLVIPSVDMNTGDVICFTSKKVRGFSDKTIYINNSNIGRAVQASCSYPVIFEPCNFNKRKLIDGGIRENSPWRELKILGADKVISVIFENISNEKECKNFIDVSFRAIELAQRELSEYENRGSDYEIKIESEKTSLLDMKKIGYFYELGYKETKKNLKNLI